MGRRGVLCPYCNHPSSIVLGSFLHPLNQHVASKKFHYCERCQAWVGCHGRSKRPLGRISDSLLRRSKQTAHAAFDPIWKSGHLSRTQAYEWLAQQMGLPVHRCHIGYFDVDQCRKVEAISDAYRKSNSISKR